MNTNCGPLIENHEVFLAKINQYLNQLNKSSEKSPVNVDNNELY